MRVDSKMQVHMRIAITVFAMTFWAVPAAYAEADASGHTLEFMYGEWRGPAVITQRDGGKIRLTQTERIGPMQDGDIVVFEGSGYDETGAKTFNAFAIVSPTGPDGAWEMRSYNRGYAGTYPFEPRETGFVWSAPAGPNARTVYEADFSDGKWRQTGRYIAEGQDPVTVIEFVLTRISDTDWPAAGAVPPGE